MPIQSRIVPQALAESANGLITIIQQKKGKSKSGVMQEVIFAAGRFLHISG